MKWILIIALLVLPASAAHSQQKYDTKQQGYNHDSRGLEQQLDVALKAYTELKFADVDKQFSRFVIPNAQAWFSQYFPQDQVNKLAKQQAKAVNDWETDLTALMEFFPKGTRFRIHCTREQSATPKKTQPTKGSILPVSPPPIETYMLAFSANKSSAFGARQFASVAVVVYYDGAYRFVGDESGPFWLAPPKEGDAKH